MTRAEILKIAKPILFNTEMVRAILDNRKTVTRRVVKLQPFAVKQDENAPCWCGHFVSESGKVLSDKPPYRPGDILYVRETWCRAATHIYWYKSDSPVQNILWRPSIHMPKEAARLFLRVTNVRVERLQDIDDDEALKEGCGIWGDVDWVAFPAEDFKRVWGSTIKPADRSIYGWGANPWVWVIGFEKMEAEK